jgi:hypothetical protein
MPFYQKITNDDKAQITFSYDTPKSLTFTNTHASNAVTIDLYVTSQDGGDVVSSTVLAAEQELSSSDSVTLTVDTVSATADVFKDERVYNSDGVFLGVCTSVTNTTTIVFADGLENAIENNDILYTGNRYLLLNNVVIPNGASLKLNSDEFSFNANFFNLYIISSNSDGDINIVSRN